MTSPLDETSEQENYKVKSHRLCDFTLRNSGCRLIWGGSTGCEGGGGSGLAVSDSVCEKWEHFSADAQSCRADDLAVGKVLIGIYGNSVGNWKASLKATEHLQSCQEFLRVSGPNPTTSQLTNRISRLITRVKGACTQTQKSVESGCGMDHVTLGFRVGNRVEHIAPEAKNSPNWLPYDAIVTEEKGSIIVIRYVDKGGAFGKSIEIDLVNGPTFLRHSDVCAVVNGCVQEAMELQPPSSGPIFC